MSVQSRIRYTVPADIQTVWRTVTSLTDYAWRSDLAKIERLDDTQFVEHTQSGAATLFRVTQTQPPHLWAFDMENDNFSGHWTGRFTAVDDKRTELDFAEDITLKKRLPRWLAKFYLYRQQPPRFMPQIAERLNT